mmetsp:Transcript_17434/g.24834  ORF Transcript_17434/g.24834 Transcript_17434/m.24834 type:complete len:83 (-) Transcript_17434:1327-1575(-)
MGKRGRIAYPQTVTQLLVTFDRPGLYVWHCHILSHEDNEMMLPYCIGEPGVDCPAELFDGSQKKGSHHHHDSSMATHHYHHS